MPLNTENESYIPDNSDDTTQRLEKYGVWVKKAPHEVKEQKNDVNDNDTTLSLDELSGITSSFNFIEEEPETEEVNLEEFGIQEQEIIEETEEELPEQSIFNSFDEEINSLISDDIDIIAPKEITDTEEFIIDNGGEEEAKTDIIEFSADDVLSDVIKEEETQTDIDFDNFKSFEETYGNLEVSSTKIEEATSEESNFGEAENSFIDNKTLTGEETVPVESSLETEEFQIDDAAPEVEPDADSKEPAQEEKSSFDDIDFSSFADGDVDLSAFMDDDSTLPQPVSSSSEEIDLDSFMSDGSSGGFSDGDIDLSAFMDGAESVHLDNFMPSDQSAVEITDEPPLNMNLSFDDNFAVETKADPVNDVETISMNADGGISEFSSFDDMFDSITDENESITDFTKSEEPLLENSNKKESPIYDDASEFDDLLSSLDETPQVQVTKEESKAKTIISDYDLSVNLEDDVNSVIIEKEDIDETDDSEIDDIPLFTGSDSGSFYKELEKTHDTGYTISKTLEAGSDMEFDELDDLLKEADLVSDNPAEDTISFEEETISLSDSQEDDEINTDNGKEEEITVTEESLQDDLSSQETIIDDFDISFDDIDSMQETQLSSDDSFIQDSSDENTELNDIAEEEIVVEETVLSSESDNVIIDDTIVTPDGDDFEAEQVIKDSNNEELPDETFEFSTDEDEIFSENRNDIEASDDGIFESEFIEKDAVIEEEETINTIINEEDAVFEDLDITDTSTDETISEIEPEIDIEIPQDSIFPDSNTEELDDLSQSLSDDFSLDDDIDQELDIQEHIDQEYLEETQEDFAAEQENSMDADSNPLLDKISQEISILRAEISSLKNELSSLKNIDAKTKEDAVKESGGFFTDDEGDDTIALSGDELNNILINADFTEEYAEVPHSDIVDTTIVETPEEDLLIEQAPEEEDFTLEQTPEEDLLIGQAPEEEDFTLEQTPEEDLSIEQTSEEDEITVEQTSQETQNIELEPFDPFGSVSDVDSISEIEQEDFFEDDSLTIDENLQEPSPEELSIDSIAFTAIEEDYEPSAPSVPDVEDIIVGPSNSDFMESIEEPVESVIEDIEIEKTDDEAEDTFDEPTGTVFESSQWEEQPEEEADQIESSLNEHEDIDAEPVSTQVVEEIKETKDSTTSTAVPKELQQDIKSVLLYMDQLLENLPEDKIEEFARSEHFNVYKKLFSELGLV